jgi:hypothetical protein
MGLDQPSAEILFRHIRASVDRKKQSDSVRLTNLCAKRQSIRHSNDPIRELGDIQQEADDERQPLVNEVPRLLGAQAYATIAEATDDARLSLAKVAIDPVTYLAANPEFSVSDALQRACAPRPAPVPSVRKRSVP